MLVIVKVPYFDDCQHSAIDMGPWIGAKHSQLPALDMQASKTALLPD